MTIVLVCNYSIDRQQSMLRFGELLAEQWHARGQQPIVLSPAPTFLRRIVPRSGRNWEKWVGYVDKYVIFPRRLRALLRQLAATDHPLVHVVDHSNAVYVPRRSPIPWIVTCHDLLAVRGALGENTDCPASALGRRLQRAITAGLGRAAAVACDSQSTLCDLNRIVQPMVPAQIRKVINLGFSYPYRPLSEADAMERLQSLAGVPWTEPFLLHVGSNLARKNKVGVFRVFARWAAETEGNLVFCGAPLPPEVGKLAKFAGLRDRVFSIPSLSNDQLEAVYSLAHGLVFPSRCEGFGWPVIEAQACGCPVVSSSETSLPEIGGDAAIVHLLADEAGMADSLLGLAEPEHRAAVIARGFANAARFSTDRMVDEYWRLYEEVLAQLGVR